MGKRLPGTPRSRVRSSLRMLFLRSRERAAAIKREEGTCQICHRKQSKAKGKEFSIEVHHKGGGIPWEGAIDFVFKHILVPPEQMEVLCPECHQAQHEKGPAQ
jgi:predicted HNH restriction endonuclease